MFWRRRPSADPARGESRLADTRPFIDAILQPFCGRTERQKILSLDITEHCNLSCRECSAGIPAIRDPRHLALREIEAAAGWLHGYETLAVTGGEPTLHPEFRRIVPRLKQWFGADRLVLATNGHGVVRHADLLHHFDEVLISRYPGNQRAVRFVERRFPNGRPPGPTLHLARARRARNPSPCYRASIAKCSFGRLYPCCYLVDGHEEIGVPLGPGCREEQSRVPLPCRDCCFAEEGPETETREDDATDAPPPRSRHDILIHGLDLDSWMHREAELRLRPHRGATRLRLHCESHAPARVRPQTLQIRDAAGTTVHTRVVDAPGAFATDVALERLVTGPGYSRATVHCDKTFVPHALDAGNPDTRELGLRVASLEYL